MHLLLGDNHTLILEKRIVFFSIKCCPCPTTAKVTPSISFLIMHFDTRLSFKMSDVPPHWFVYWGFSFLLYLNITSTHEYNFLTFNASLLECGIFFQYWFASFSNNTLGLKYTFSVSYSWMQVIVCIWKCTCAAISNAKTILWNIFCCLSTILAFCEAYIFSSMTSQILLYSVPTKKSNFPRSNIIKLLVFFLHCLIFFRCIMKTALRSSVFDRNRVVVTAISRA